LGWQWGIGWQPDRITTDLWLGEETDAPVRVHQNRYRDRLGHLPECDHGDCDIPSVPGWWVCLNADFRLYLRRDGTWGHGCVEGAVFQTKAEAESAAMNATPPVSEAETDIQETADKSSQESPAG